MDDGSTILVTELPIGVWTLTYLQKLSEMQKAGTIRSYRPIAKADESIHIEITGMSEPTYRKLGLTKTYGLNNLVLLDEKNVPIRYETSTDILKHFMVFRLGKYQARKEMIISDYNRQIKQCEMKLEFVRAIKQSKINVREGATRKAIYLQMESQGFSKELLKTVNIGNLTDDDVKRLTGKIVDYRNKRDEIMRIPAIEMWLDDLDAFECAYRKHYKMERMPERPRRGREIDYMVKDDKDEDDDEPMSIPSETISIPVVT